MEAVMLRKQNSAAGKPECFSLSTSFAPRNPESSSAPDGLAVSSASPASRAWLARLAQFIKDLIGEPPNTTLPDLNQENP
jgi:hypothetical protein